MLEGSYKIIRGLLQKSFQILNVISSARKLSLHSLIMEQLLKTEFYVQSVSDKQQTLKKE